MSFVRASLVVGLLGLGLGLAACAEKSSSPTAVGPQAPQDTPQPIAQEPAKPTTVAPEESRTLTVEELRVTRAKAPPAAAASPAGGGDKNSGRVQQTTHGAALSPEIIHRVVRQSYPQLHACYEAGLRQNPTLQGRLSVKLVIAKDGAIRSASVTTTDFPDKTVSACVEKTFAGLTFPAPDHGELTVAYPVAFSPSDG